LALTIDTRARDVVRFSASFVMEHILNGGASAVRQAPSTTCLGCYEETTTGPRTLAGAAFFNYTAVTPEMCGAPSSAYVYYGIVCGGECQFSHILFYLMADGGK
jgi:hypothetical protein